MLSQRQENTVLRVWHVGLVTNIVIVTYLILPIAFVGATPTAKGTFHIAPRRSVSDLLEVPESEFPDLVWLAVCLAEFRTARVCVTGATMVALILSLIRRLQSSFLLIVRDTLTWGMLVAFWIQIIAIFMCVS